MRGLVWDDNRDRHKKIAHKTDFEKLIFGRWTFARFGSFRSTTTLLEQTGNGQKY